MKYFISSMSQTPLKPLAPSWFRAICQADLVKRSLRSLGHEVEHCRSVDDTALQVAQMMSIVSPADFPKSGVGDFLGARYVEMSQHGVTQSHVDQKLKLESGEESSRDWLRPHLMEQKNLLESLAIDVGDLWWESDLISSWSHIEPSLEKANRLLDYRPVGGDLFLDFTDHQIKLAKLEGKQGKSYLLKNLLFYTNQIKRADALIIQGLDEDQHLNRIETLAMSSLNVPTKWFLTSRVKLDGVAKSSRLGGWQDYTLSKILERCAAHDIEDIRLGLRLYFLGKCSENRQFSFSLVELQQHIRMATQWKSALGSPIHYCKDCLMTPETKKFFEMFSSLNWLQSPGTIVRTALMFWSKYKKDKQYADALRMTWGVLGG